MIILDLILTVIIYLSFPVTYRLIFGRVSVKKAKKMAIINSVVCAIIFEIFQLISFANDTSYTPNFLPAIPYYYIAKAILKEKEKYNPTILK